MAFWGSGTIHYMMGYGLGYGYGGMMVGSGGVLCVITWIVVIVDLVLVGIWLWKQIQK